MRQLRSIQAKQRFLIWEPGRERTVFYLLVLFFGLCAWLSLNVQSSEKTPIQFHPATSAERSFDKLPF